MHRLTRRQLLLADVPVLVIGRGADDCRVPGPTMHLVVLPDGDHPDLTAAAILEVIDEIQVQLDDRQVALVVGPSATLTDQVTDPVVLRLRDVLLRDGRVRAIVRLPAGLRPARPRENLGLWLLANADNDVPVLERRIGVADLSTGKLTPMAIESLVSDLLAARQGRHGARHRAWAHLAHVATSDLLASSGSLVTVRRHRRAVAEKSATDWLRVLHHDDEGLGLLAGLHISCGSAAQCEETTMSQAIASGLLRVLPGHRVDLGELPAGNVPVIGVPKVAGGRSPGSVGVDRLTLLTRTGVRLTDPGDIVFTTAGQPRAIIDGEGGSLVLAPARILRLTKPGPLVTASVLARINAAEPKASWQSWTFAVLPEGDSLALSEALDTMAMERMLLVKRLTRVDALVTDLTAAVESGRITIALENKEREHGSTSYQDGNSRSRGYRGYPVEDSLISVRDVEVSDEDAIYAQRAHRGSSRAGVRSRSRPQDVGGALPALHSHQGAPDPGRRWLAIRVCRERALRRHRGCA